MIDSIEDIMCPYCKNDLNEENMEILDCAFGSIYDSENHIEEIKCSFCDMYFRVGCEISVEYWAQEMEQPEEEIEMNDYPGQELMWD